MTATAIINTSATNINLGRRRQLTPWSTRALVNSPRALVNSHVYVARWTNNACIYICHTWICCDMRDDETQRDCGWESEWERGEGEREREKERLNSRKKAGRGRETHIHKNTELHIHKLFIRLFMLSNSHSLSNPITWNIARQVKRCSWTWRSSFGRIDCCGVPSKCSDSNRRQTRN